MSEQNDEETSTTNNKTTTASSSSQQSTTAPNVRGGPSNGATRLNNNAFSRSDNDISGQSCQC